ncbi:MAG: hypothetical protein HY288_10975 [Planctomycetia bacterium]|nr:hypothetical protein [Planctomycetia bacterium]
MMSRILVVALACVLSLASVSFGFELGTPSTFDSGQSQNGWPAPKPSGLRFPDATVSVQTGAGEGNVPCAACGQLGTCIYWTLLPWYGSWDDGHHRGAGCRHCCAARY